MALRRPVLSLLAAALLPALVAVPATPPAAAAAPAVTGTEADLGVQIPGAVGSVRSDASAQGVIGNLGHLAFFAVDGGPGVPARFLAMDLAGAVVAEVAIPAGTDVESLVYSPASKTVFVAANAAKTGYLYEWNGSALSQRATVGQEVMRLAAAPDGAIYVGTYAPSNGRLYRLSGGTLTDLGQPFTGESYVMSIAVDSANVWVSNYQQSAAKLVRIDRASNARTAVAVPAAFSGEWSALDMTRAGSFLFLRTVNSNRLFAYNVSTGRFASFNDQIARVYTSPEVANPVPYIDGISQFAISGLVENRYVFFQRAKAGLMRVDLADGLKAVRVDRYNQYDNAKPWVGASVYGPQSYAWLSGVAGRTGSSLVTTTVEGKVVVNSPGQEAPVVRTLAVTDSPSRIDTIGSDAAGNVYSGGFDLPAGIGKHATATGQTSLLAGPQIEGFGRFNSTVVMGGYTGSDTQAGPIYAYDGGAQPVLRTHLGNSQERPVAIQQVGSKVAIGSVPIKNQRGGALSIWEPASNALTVKRNIIADQSVISLGTAHGLVVGGSSNTGGTGATPANANAQIFTYNPANGVVKTLTPPQFESATYRFVAAITPDPTAPAHFWAISTGHLIQFRVASDGTITLTRNLTTLPNTTSPTGKGLGIAFVDGVLFATVDGGLSAYNPVTGERTIVAKATSAGSVTGLTAAGGDLYYARGVRLYRYEVGGTGSSTDFFDVSSSHPFHGQITWLAESGVTTGYPDRTFRPSSPVSREAMSAFLYRFAGEPAHTPPSSSPFNDVTTGHPFYDAITWLAAEEITTGYRDGGYHPGSSVSREAMAAFLYRMAGEPAHTAPTRSPFRDVSTSHPFYEAITWLADQGISTGYTDGTFRPGASVNRDAMAAFLQRFDAKGLLPAA